MVNESMASFDKKLADALGMGDKVLALEIAKKYFKEHPCLTRISLTASGICYELIKENSSAIVILKEMK